MKTIPVITPPKKPASRPKKTCQPSAPGNGQQSESERVFLHDVVNQLTIISLACFELYTPPEYWNDKQKKAIAAIENAVQSAAELVQRLSRLIKDQTGQTEESVRNPPAQAHSANNVYPISPYLKNR
ncbi:MAG TPA: hypothetical protein VLX11_12035 [Candidatus Acidoferrales bacterium]|nr:hypothetical protein [Candidatus Acidoferrales bacterium]